MSLTLLALVVGSALAAPSTFRIALVVDSQSASAASGVTTSMLNDTISGAWCESNISNTRYLHQ